MLTDLRYALRTLRQNPGFTAVAVLTLALGIGANTAVFTVVARALIDRLPYRAPDRLVVLYGATSDNPGARDMLSATEITEIQQHSRSLSAVAGFGLHGGYTYVDEQRTEMWQGTRVGPTFFRTLGARPLLGRTIDDRDMEPGAPGVALLSYPLWQRVFGGDPGVIGRVVWLNDVSRTVVGVMPPAFVAPWRTPEVWVPLDLEPVLAGRAARSRMLTAVGRLADGATLAQTRAELDLLERATDQQVADARRSPRVNPVSVRDAMVGDVRPVLLVVMGAAMLVLVLACVNLAGLLLARATARRHELAVRAALGAGRWRLVRQLLTESTLLGVAGGALGVALAFWGKDVLVSAGSLVLPVMGQPPRIDAGVLAFAVAVSLASGIAFGVVPALLGARTDVSATLGESGRGAAGGRLHSRVGRALVVGQVTLAVVLLIGAGLLGRTLMALEDTDMGYSTDDHVLTFRTNLAARRYADPASETQFFTTLLERIRALPGVEAAGMIAISPWNGWYSESVEIEGGSAGAADSASVVLAPVSDGYFAGLGIPVRAGRAILSTDRAGAPGVAVISERMARRLWPSRNPLGARLRFRGLGTPWSTVVGIVGDVRESPATEPPSVAYLSAWQLPQGGYEFVVGTTGDAAALIGPIRRELHELGPAVPLVSPRSMVEVMRGSLAGQRLPMAFTTAFALLALVLAALGIHGVTAYAVTARARELGIRTALGGRRADILWLVLRQALTTAAIGVVIGLALAAAGARVLAGLLYGVTTHDAVTFLAAPGLLLVVSAAACLVPARRAIRIDPMETVRAV